MRSLGTLRQRRLLILVFAGAASTTMAAPSLASASLATTAGATSITSTSAVLNGAVSPGGVPTAWFFQYGTTTSYASHTPAAAITTHLSVVNTVQTIVTNLQPGTTYHYRLVAGQGYPVVIGTGNDLMFTTLTSTGGSPGGKGKASLQSRRLTVRHGVVSIPLKCSGNRGAKCKGKVSLATRTKSGKTVSCAGGSYGASTGRTHTVKRGVGKKCLALLKAANGHKLGATFKATFSTNQGALRKSVTLVLA
jgi:hypothetical protein